jgi:DNA-binding SARP family transcriptional activator
MTQLAGRPPFQLILFGGFRLSGPDGEPVRIVAKKARALLAYLALQPAIAHSRSKLAALLWEDVGAEQARASLRQTLTVLRRVCPGLSAGLKAEMDTVALHPPEGAIDVAQFACHLAAGHIEALRHAVDLYTGDLLDGLDLRAPAFDNWLATERQHLRERVLNALERLLDHHWSTGRFDQALSASLRLVALDPLRESAHRSVMALYARNGHSSLALKHYRYLCAVLEQELGVAPEPETESLHRAILTQRRRRDMASMSGRPASPMVRATETNSGALAT